MSTLRLWSVCCGISLFHAGALPCSLTGLELMLLLCFQSAGIAAHLILIKDHRVPLCITPGVVVTGETPPLSALCSQSSSSTLLRLSCHLRQSKLFLQPFLLSLIWFYFHLYLIIESVCG